MRQGFKVYDSDTHVNPAAEILDQYVDPSFRARLVDLAPYRQAFGQAAQGSGQLQQYRVGTKYYRRILGTAVPSADFTGRGTNWKGSKPARARVQDDGAANRIKDMDDEGSDVHFLIPTGWLSVVALDDVSLEVGLSRAFHRYMADFCGQFPDRFTGLIVASTRNVEAAVQEIRQWGTSPWAVAVMPLLSLDMPADHPSLEPIWQAAQEHDLAIVHHSFTWNPPYFPGYQDLWDNIFLGRLASHPWGAMRFIAAFIGAGIMDRYTDLRLGVLECGYGWLPFWGKRMDEQASYVGGISQLKQRPSEYLTSGRFFCSLDLHEGEDMFNNVTHFLGDEVLMFSTDYPHAECHFPDSVDEVLGWTSLKPDTQQKLMWDNARRFFKRT
jgi:predicted TIM-barrel fold metal-dependent hydrolase